MSMSGSHTITPGVQYYTIEVRPRGLVAEITVTRDVSVWRVWLDRDLVAWGTHSLDAVGIGHEGMAAAWVYRVLECHGVTVTRNVQWLMGQAGTAPFG